MRTFRGGVKFYIYTLGCPKNEVDSEIISSTLIRSGFKRTDNVGEADIILINSCGFIETAKEESINVAFDLYRLKRDDQKIVMLGCLAQRYADEIPSLMKEVNGFIGADRYKDIDKILKKICAGIEGNKYWGNSRSVSLLYKARDRLIRKADKSYTFVKIADGCSNRCGFCAIPLIKGRYRSREIDDILSEIDALIGAGYREIGLVSQDLTAFGSDLKKRESLLHLLKEIEGLKGDFWIRLYYLYPRRIDRRVLDLIGESKKIVHYLDIPLQHSSDDILKRMRRGHNQLFIKKMISEVRERLPDVILRSTFIVGFPSESRGDFLDLMRFLMDLQIDNAGFFPYSDEEGTQAYNMEKKVDKRTIRSRLQKAYEVQEEISYRKNKDKIGKIYRVLLDSTTEEYYIGRYYGQAPEIDGVVYIKKDSENRRGFAEVKIIGADSYDLYGEFL